IRNRDALRQGPLTFRDHFLSLYQSIVAEIAEGVVTDKKAAAAGHEAATGYEATSPDAVSDLVLAAERLGHGNACVRAMSAPSAKPVDVDGSLERKSPLDHAATCAGLGWELLKARISGDDAGAKLLQQQLNAGSCDPRWADTIAEYMKYFGLF